MSFTDLFNPSLVGKSNYNLYSESINAVSGSISGTLQVQNLNVTGSANLNGATGATGATGAKGSTGATGSNILANLTQTVYGATATGIWADPQTFNITANVLGTPLVTATLVTIYFNSITSFANNVNFVSISSDLPLNLRPVNSTNWIIPVIDNGVFITGGQLTIEGANIFVSCNGQSDFSGSGASGWSDFFVSYFV